MRAISVRHIGGIAICAAASLAVAFAAGLGSQLALVLLLLIAIGGIVHLATTWRGDNWFVAIVLNVTIGIASGPALLFGLLGAITRPRGIEFTAPPGLGAEIRIIAFGLPLCVTLIACPVGVIARRLSRSHRARTIAASDGDPARF